MMGIGRSAATDSEPRLIKGVAVLGLAAIISKLLGTLQKIPLQNIAGDEAYGIYSAVYPFYVLILFLATAGFPVAVSKLVSEQAAAGNLREARRIYRIASWILAATGLAGFLFMYFGAELIAGWIGASQAAPAVRSVSYALLIVPLMAASRGYFQGLQNMIPTAVSQVAEQTVRVAVMIVLLLLLTEAQAPSGIVAAGATFGSAAGAAAGLIVMLLFDWRARSAHRRGRGARSAAAKAAVAATRQPALIRRIISHALPVALGSIAVPIISMIDSFTLPNLLAYAHGLSEREALHEFGVYARGLPLVQLVAMLFSSMSAALVPAMSNALALGERDLVRRRTQVALRLTWMIGLAASCGLAVLSLPINIMLFTDGSGTSAMAIVAWTALFSSLNVVTAAILQGVSKERLPALHLLLAAALKVILNILLIPLLGIAGAAWSGVIAYAVAVILNMRAALHHTGAKIRMKQDVAKPLLSAAVMVGVILLLYGGFALLAWLLGADGGSRVWNTLLALTMIVVGAAVFGIAVLRSGAISEADLLLVPALHRRLTPLLRRWRILRS